MSANRQPAAPAVRAVHLEESWPAGEVEDGERRGRRLREQARQKRVRPGTRGKSGNHDTLIRAFISVQPVRKVNLSE